MEMDNDDDDTATLNKPPSPSKCPIPERQQELYRLQSQSIKTVFKKPSPVALVNTPNIFLKI